MPDLFTIIGIAVGALVFGWIIFDIRQQIRHHDERSASLRETLAEIDKRDMEDIGRKRE